MLPFGEQLGGCSRDPTGCLCATSSVPSNSSSCHRWPPVRWGVPGGQDFLLPWLLRFTMYQLCERPCGAPFRDPKAGT